MKNIKRLLPLLLCVILLAACGEIKQISFNSPTPPVFGGDTEKPTATAVPTEKPTGTNERPEPSISPTGGQEPVLLTETPTPTPTMQPATPTPNPTKAPMTENDARKKVEAVIDRAVYTVSGGEKIAVEGTVYYLFEVSDASQVFDPAIVVRAIDGMLFYYNSYSEITAFTSFPPDKVEIAGTDDEEGITSDEAIDLLKTLPEDDLSLPNPLDEYYLSVDEWTSMVRGTECYGINVYEQTDGKRQLVGIYFVAVDASLIYKNEYDDFILIY